jgi:dUTP pyrophosphatase
VKVKIKKLHPDAVIPTYAHAADAGLDLVAVDRYQDEHGNMVYKTGLAFEIPEGYVGLLFPRSSVSKYNMSVANCIGVIDAPYRGEVTLKFRPAYSFKERAKYEIRIYEIGERIAQLIIMPFPHIEFEEVEELSDTERGQGGYGSTGK